MIAGGKATDSDGKRISDQMRIEFVVQSRLAVCPGAKTPRKRCQIPPKAVFCVMLRGDRRVQPKYLSNQVGERDNIEPLV